MKTKSSPNRLKKNMEDKNLSEQLKQKSIDGFLNCVERFNSPREQGRVDAVLILLGHACEMLLKSALVHNGINIYSGKHSTLSLMDCVNEFSSDGRVPILLEEHIRALRIISSLRNHAQHLQGFFIPEEMLYYCASNGIQIFQIVMNSVHGENPDKFMPPRVLSFAKHVPMDIVNIVTKGAADIMRGSAHKNKERLTATMRGLATVESAIGGKEIIPSKNQVERLLVKISHNPGSGIDVIFPMIASTKKISKSVEIPTSEMKEGDRPITIVPDGDPTAERVIYQNKSVPGDVFHRFIMKDIQLKIGVNQLEARALEYSLGLRGKQKYHRTGRYGENFYSEEALDAMSKAGGRFKREQSYREQVLAKYKARKIKKK